MASIDMNKLRNIIREELAETQPIKKGMNHEEAAAVAAAASKLLGALEAFEDKAPPSAKDALMNRAPDVKQALEDMVGNPGTYVLRMNAPNAKASDAEKPLEQVPNVTVHPQGKPVLDHKQFVESINRRIRARKRST